MIGFRIAVFAFLLSLAATADDAPFPALSQTGLYENIATKAIDPANRPFSPQYPLWTDGARKQRWFRLPPGTRIDTHDPDHWTFPVGTRFWKEFSFLRTDGAGYRRIETRLEEKTGPQTWRFVTYLWREDESDADLAPNEGKPDYYPTSPTTNHDIPSEAQCLECHKRGGDRVLGFEALQLSDDRDPQAEPLSAGMVTLQTLIRESLVTKPPDSMPRVLGNPITRTAQGYLHANCGSCHNPQGSAVNTTIKFRYPVGTKTEKAAPAFATTVNKQADTPAGWVRIVPGAPDRSAVLFRMIQTDHRLRMPQIGTKLVDEEGAEKIRKWIGELSARASLSPAH